jgi:hypothetical protein
VGRPHERRAACDGRPVQADGHTARRSRQSRRGCVGEGARHDGDARAEPVDPLIYAADRDATASGATIKTFISDKATSVTFRVTTLDGTLVHERTPSLKASTSAYQWTWRGVDAAGERVPVGRYKLAVIVSSPAGDEWWGKTVFVGPFRVSVSTAHPSRGDELTFKVISTEPLEGAPTITVKQPNLKPYTVVTDATSKKATYQAEFKLSTAADAGRTTMTVSGVDENGQTQTRTIVVVVD